MQVERVTDSWEDESGWSIESESNKLKPLIGIVTSCDQDGGFINQTTYFPHDALSKGFKPIKGDWVQAQYFISPTEWSSQARSVSPLRYRRIDQVCVSSICGRNGVVDDQVFFNLDSLLLPRQYNPTPGDIVTVIVVESSQSLYCWRALCMAPCDRSVCVMPVALMGSHWESQSLLQNRGGLQVSTDTSVGSLLLGESKELQIWIENRGSETHRLLSCGFAGLDPEAQFTVSLTGEAPPTTKTGTQPTHEAPDAVGSCTLGQQSKGKGGAQTESPPEELSKASVKEPQRFGDRDITPGERLSISVRCQAKSLGRCAEMLLLHFHSFTIRRRLEVVVTSTEESLLQPSSPYCPARPWDTPKLPAVQTITVLPGPSIHRNSKRTLPSFLGQYPVPQLLRECLETQGDVLVAQPELGQPLSLDSLRPRFSALLWLEELHAEAELKQFSLTSAILGRSAEHLQLEVPGLAEGRPNINIGDKVILRKPQTGGLVVEYIAYVTEICEEDVSLRVNSEFQQSYLGEPLCVEFTLNRLTMRRCHGALEQARHLGEAVLFPSCVVVRSPQWSEKWGEEEEKDRRGSEHDGVRIGFQKLFLPTQEQGPHTTDEPAMGTVFMDMVSVATQTKTDFDTLSFSMLSAGGFFNPALNTHQRAAVRQILIGECRPTPYILFGPPGTGKTITLIEAILQIYHRLPSSRLLVCSPSNSAADLLCSRMHHSGFLQSGSLVRLNATCRLEESVPEEVRPYCRAGEDVRQAAFHRIIISTCSSAGMLYQLGLRVGHFSHVFIDEAGQATEPETLIPLGLLSEREGQIVLVGDPRQLGPVVKCRLASAFGLGVSLLERLMGLPLYSRDEARFGHSTGYNPLLVTKLVCNYRSHEALLTLPSRLFYAGALCVGAEPAVVESLSDWSQLPRRGFPLLFHGVRGREMREGKNPSWFNPAEAVQVMLYCCQLAKRLFRPVAPADIGIIAPYRKQVEKIRMLLQRVGLSEVRVGSVEEFQGQEFLVILISTVRSNEDLLEEDVHSALGFLSNPKRFNVAITRAKALLIIVGNPHVLVKVCNLF
ncbi:M10L1 helicase, partial [Amia calva]|nr:M10L1 helicase [Amia calva]